MYYAKSDLSLGITEEKLVTNNVYPNPTTGLIYTEKEFASVKVYNSQGSLIMEKQSSTYSKVIDISSLPSGIYLLNLESGEGISRTKVFKK